MIKNFAVKLRHLGKHMKIDSKKPDKKKKRHNEEMSVSTITKKKRVSPHKEASKRKFLKINALRHPYQCQTE